jgi:hypothetical protein
MSLNDPGSYRTTRRAGFRAFDKLPPVVREALASGLVDWVPQPMLRDYKNGMRPSVIVAWIEYYDKLELEQREGERRLAIGVWKGNVPT